MRMLGGLGMILLACGGSSSGPAPGDESGSVPEAESVPTDWVRVESACGYGFLAPPELRVHSIMGTDSCVDEWATDRCVYRGDYGFYSSPLTEYEERPAYEETRSSVDGRAATLVTAGPGESFIAGVHFPQVEPDAEGVKLTLWAECQDAAGQRDALNAFRTLTFGRED